VISLGYRTTGGPDDGPPVVLLHALGSSARTWTAFAAALPRQSIAVDLRGHGTSPHAGDYSFTTMADDVLAFLDEHGHATVDLVGHSLGGAVAQFVAMAAPDRVRRMVVEDISPPPHEPVDLPEVPARTSEPIDFDWAVVEPIWRLVRTQSHIDQTRLREAAARMPSARVVEVPVGHRIHSEAPEEFAAAVIPFLTTP
jgi:pimeloyl-ACP methyl ester carboxylesterase